MAYLYLTLIPTLIAIALLFFGKNISKKYNVKRTVPILLVFLMAKLIFISYGVWSIYKWPRTNISAHYSLWQILYLAFIFVLFPIIVLYQNKINRKETIFDKKWVQILCAIVFIIVFVSILFFI